MNKTYAKSKSVDFAEEEMSRGHYAFAEAILVGCIQNGVSDFRVWSLMAKVSCILLKHGQALFSAYKANEIRSSREMQAIFVESLPFIQFASHDVELQSALAKAVFEGWGSPEVLNSFACKLLKLDPAFVLLSKKNNNGSDARSLGLLHQPEFIELSKNTLLLNALVSAPLCDIELEALVISMRKALLFTRDADHFPELVSAIAQQCFINEYLFAVSDQEELQLLEIKDHLASSNCHYSWLLFACYEPLTFLVPSTFDMSDRYLQPVLTMQVTEPKNEQTLKAQISNLSTIFDQTSNGVRQMYEESPYPRWTKLEPSRPVISFNDYMKQNFQTAELGNFDTQKKTRVLVAGGGTGRHPIQIAQRYSDVDVDVIDLSLASLAYAKRKSMELKITNVQYYQLDILNCACLNKQYDVIEAVGVLHHMSDPWAAWKMLLGRLKSGGFMRLGLYSIVARSEVNAVRDFIKENNYGSTPNDVRRYRSELICYAQKSGMRDVLRMGDFYTTSSCRDLLFHIQEAQVTIAEISEFLALNELTFLGFEVGPAADTLYKQTYPDDKARNNLQNWSIFEESYPKTFLGMYQFWVQKN